MLGFFIGFLVAMMLVRFKLRRMGRAWRFGAGRTFMLRRLYRHLGTDTAQEREIATAVDGFMAATHDLRGDFRDMKHDLADVLRSRADDGTVDEGLMDEILDRQTATVETAQEAFRTAFERIHAVLDDRQREQLADMLEHGFHRRGPSSGGCGRWRRRHDGDDRRRFDYEAHGYA